MKGFIILKRFSIFGNKTEIIKNECNQNVSFTKVELNPTGKNYEPCVTLFYNFFISLINEFKQTELSPINMPKIFVTFKLNINIF